MKKKQTILLCVILVAVIVVAGFAAYVITREKYTYINGSVTAYDPSPAAYDGSIIFKINTETVDIGGGERAPSKGVGDVYRPIHVGDKVKAKLVTSDFGRLTVYGCPECYIEKQK